MSTQTLPARILIVDDHPAAREGLAVRISRQQDLEVCGEAADVAEALELVTAQNPDLVVVDISLKTGNGIDLIKRIKASGAKTQMLVWSMHDESLYAERALRAGAMGYINKAQATEKMVDAIRCVLSNRVYLDQATAERLLDRASGSDRLTEVPSLASLSDRELEVFQLMGQGLDLQQIAEHIGVGRKTVETYRARIKEKLSLASGTELLRLALRSALAGD